jgi:hypothetical protein
MYALGLMTLIGLGVYAVAVLVDRYVAVAREFVAGLYGLLGVGAAWLANFDLFKAWAMPAREPWIGVTLTGLAIAGLAMAWRAIGTFVAGLERKFRDEAEVLEQTELRRVA